MYCLALNVHIRANALMCKWRTHVYTRMHAHWHKHTHMHINTYIHVTGGIVCVDGCSPACPRASGDARPLLPSLQMRMCVFAQISLRIHTVATNVYIYVCTSVSTCVNLNSHWCILTRTSVNTHKYAWLARWLSQTHTHAHEHEHTQTRTHTHTHTHTLTHIHTHAYILTHQQLHTYTHPCTRTRKHVPIYLNRTAYSIYTVCMQAYLCTLGSHSNEHRRPLSWQVNTHKILTFRQCTHTPYCLNLTRIEFIQRESTAQITHRQHPIYLKTQDLTQ